MQESLTLLAKRNFVLLFLAQAMIFSTAPTLIFSGALIGLELSGQMALSTIPVAALVIGTASFTVPAALFMARFGRRLGFIGGNLIALVGVMLAIMALFSKSFVLFIIAAILMGANYAVMMQYRFAVAEGVPPQWQSRFISWLTFASLLGAITVLTTVKTTQHLFAVEFVGNYALVGGMILIALVLVFFYENSNATETTELDQQSTANDQPMHQRTNQQVQGPSAWSILRQRRFIFAAGTAALGYMTMSFAMTATPLYLRQVLNYSASESALVILFHIIGMFLPSVLSGWLILHLGEQRLIRLGITLMALSAFSNTVNPTSYTAIFIGLVLLGVGWNFMFVPATVYLSKHYRGAIRFRAQGLNELFVFSSQAIVSLLAGWYLFSFGWHSLNWILMPLLLLWLVFSFSEKLS